MKVIDQADGHEEASFYRAIVRAQRSTNQAWVHPDLEYSHAHPVEASEGVQERAVDPLTGSSHLPDIGVDINSTDGLT